jgi:hypothetical protein
MMRLALASDRTRRELGIAATAAMVATVGDLLMLWVANAARPALALPAAPALALPLGGVLGVAAIPLYALGYRAVARALAPGSRARARLVLGCGIGAAALGAAIHGMTALGIRPGGGAGAAGASPVVAVAEHGLLVASWGVAALLVMVASAALVAGAWRSYALPRRLAWLNPAAVTLVLALAGLPSEAGRSFLLPAAPNLAHVVFFFAAGRALGRRP